MLLKIKYIPQGQLKNKKINFILGITGSGKLFDDWKKYIPLDILSNNSYCIDLNTDLIGEYKYVLINPINNYWYWEIGDNRKIEDDILIEQKDIEPRFEINLERLSGVAIPVFSLRSKQSCGVGDFNDLKLFANWASSVGMKIIQILPINDTTMSKTWVDSYPYNANSSFAIHPQYLNINELDIELTKEELKIKAELNAKECLDYQKVNELKHSIYSRYYSKINIDKNTNFIEFKNKNKNWLYPYSVYSVLRDDFNTSCFNDWGIEFSWDKIYEVVEQRKKDVNKYCFMQYILFNQLKDAVEYAHSKSISIKGDLPIGISRTSADAWQNPSLYNMKCSAGAPPDDFAKDGQNWGFPTYNWDKMQEDNFAWWKNRLSFMENFFDAYRIDHILGFFRIWEIPLKAKSALMGYFNPSSGYFKKDLENEGFKISSSNSIDCLFVKYPYQKSVYMPRIEGYKTKAYKKLSKELKESYDKLYNEFFYKRNNNLWEKGAKTKLTALLNSSNMLACGEDLGMIPSCVPSTMQELKILSLEIERMPKAYGVSFGDTKSYPYLSVAATGTHDTSNLRLWWTENKDKSQEYYNKILKQEGKAPLELNCNLVKQIINNHLQSPSMLCIIPIQDYLAISETLKYKGDLENERINNPSINNFYWKYRLHLNIEELFEENFVKDLKYMIENSNR